MSQSSAWRRWAPIVLGTVCILCAIAWHQSQSRAVGQRYATLTLLIPDRMALDAPEVRIWTQAASERGVLLAAQPVSEWMHAMNYGAPKAQQTVIVPDTFHRQMSDTVVQTLKDVVSAGGKALVVQDGGLLDERGLYPRGAARFSDMLGVQYGNYDLHREKLSDYDEIRGSASTMESLGIPPGRYLDAAASAKLTSIAPADLAGTHGSMSTFVAGYTKDSQRFTVLKTDRPTAPRILLESTHGDVVVSIHAWGQGQAMFVNLPLTYLVERTDGIFLHGFLSYFAQELAYHPALLTAPDGIGALVLNWHNDDGKAIGFLHTLQEAGIFDHGRQSMHFTAGPDVNTEGDGLGMDLEHNQAAQQMIQKLRAQGHTIGNHGGWIHNYFGANANDDNGDDFMQYLDLNNQAITKSNGGQVPQEYSAPTGNQPLWVYDWMKQHGVLAYYTSASVGMPPTRLWIGLQQIDSAWAFPVLTYGQVASAEEASFMQVPVDEFGQWLQQLAQFIEKSRSIRLSYFHPIGAVGYLPAVKAYVDAVQSCADRAQCQFLSMTEAASFLSRRELVQWSMQAQGDSDVLTASHPTSLASMAWTLPKKQYAAVQVRSGQATVQDTKSAWLVHAQDGLQLTLEMRRQP